MHAFCYGRGYHCEECGKYFVGRFKYLKDGSKVRRWRCATATNQGSQACDIAQLLRDDDALQMLKTAIQNLPIDYQSVISNLTRLTIASVQSEVSDTKKNPQQLILEMDNLKQKKTVVMDHYFSGEISKEDMQMMLQKYNQQLDELQNLDFACQIQESSGTEDLHTLVAREVTDILNGELESEAFYKNVLDELIVFKDGHMELRLQNLPHKFLFRK